MRGRGVMVLLVLVFAVGACSDLETLEPGLCGNGVLERGEDCDLHADPALGPDLACASPTSPTQACRYVCDSGAPCPLGWACRRDGVCHHATGAFEPVVGPRVSPAPEDAQLGDIDGDGSSDVVGIAATELHAWFADDRGALGDELRRPLPIGSRGTPALGDLDGDGRADVVAPTPRGLVVLRGTERRALEPVAYSPYETAAEWVVPLRVHGETGDSLLELFWGTDGVRFEVVSPRSPGSRTEAYLPIAQSVIDLHDLHDRLPVQDIDGDDDDEVLLAFEGDTELRVATTSRDFFSPAKIRFIPDRWPVDLSPDTIDRGALFADLDGDGGTDLLVSVSGGRVVAERILRVLSDGEGGFAASAPDDRFALVGWPLAAGDLDGDRVADFVLPSGLYRGLEDDLLLMADSRGSLWKEAVLADLDRDGSPDVIATEAGEPVLHILQGASQLAGPDRLDVPTGGAPSLLRVGDFDGNHVPDIAYRAGDGGLEILFGPAYDWQSIPVLVSRLPGFDKLESGVLTDFSGNSDSTSDLLVMSALDAGLPEVAAFEGAGTRVLDSPFLLARWSTDRPRAVVVGRFLPPLEGAEAVLDVLALALSPLQSSPILWLLRGAPDARFDPALAVRDEPGDPARAALSRLGGECGLWASGDVDGDGLDEAVGLGPRAGCSAAFPSPSGPALLVVNASIPDGDGVPVLEVTEQEGAPPLAARGTCLRDLDGDGAADLLLEHDGGVNVLWARDGGLQLHGSAPLPLPRGASGLVSATPLQADDDPAVEVAVLTDAGEIWIAEPSAHDFEYGPGPVARLEGARLRAGDLDGDGLDDLLVARGTEYEVLRAVSHLTSP